MRSLICMQHCKWPKKLSPEELMDAFTRKNQLVDKVKKIETANQAATRRKDNSEGKRLNGKVFNHREKD